MRVSLNLSEEIVEKVDSLVDGKKYRNRSHAVEKILSNAISPEICKKVVILVGGKEEPHPSTFKIDGKSLAEHNLLKLQKAGIEEVLFVGNNLDEIKQTLGEENGLTIKYINEEEPLGTAGALNLIKKEIKKPFIVMNGDIYIDFDITNMVSFYREKESLAVLALGTSGEGPLGKVKVKGTDLLKFQQEGELETNLVNVGFYIFDPKIFGYIPKKGMMEQKVFPKLAKEGKINSYLIGGDWKHITKQVDLS